MGEEKAKTVGFGVQAVTSQLRHADLDLDWVTGHGLRDSQTHSEPQNAMHHPAGFGGAGQTDLGTCLPVWTGWTNVQWLPNCLRRLLCTVYSGCAPKHWPHSPCEPRANAVAQNA